MIYVFYGSLLKEEFFYYFVTIFRQFFNFKQIFLSFLTINY